MEYLDWRQVQEIDGRVAPKFAIPNSSGKNAPCKFLFYWMKNLLFFSCCVVDK